MLKIIGESLLIATRMDRDLECERDTRRLPDPGEGTRRRSDMLRLPLFWR